jgi:hypothetical protein
VESLNNNVIHKNELNVKSNASDDKVAEGSGSSEKKIKRKINKLIGFIEQ